MICPCALIDRTGIALPPPYEAAVTPVLVIDTVCATPSPDALPLAVIPVPPARVPT